jgi:RNA polymerase sigma factor (sigma-70 family)
VTRLVTRFAGSAQRLAEALLGDAHRAEDAVQEAFVAAIGRLEDLREPAAFPGWFRQIVRTEANRMVRKRSEPPHGGGLERASADLSPPEQLERDERRRRVREVLAQLPPIGRETAELYYLEQNSIAEIAAALDVPTGTVKRRLHDARARLRALLLGSIEAMETPRHRPRPLDEGGPL